MTQAAPGNDTCIVTNNVYEPNKLVFMNLLILFILNSRQ